jgi:hypothetical protein
MLASFDERTGKLLAQADSFKIFPGPDSFKDHVARACGVDTVYQVVMEAGDQPWRKKFDGAKIVDDEEAIAAAQTRQDSVGERASRIDALKDKFVKRTGTLADVQEFITLTS